jgi:hypothetical protein
MHAPKDGTMSPKHDNRKTLKAVKPLSGPVVWFWQGEQSQPAVILTPSQRRSNRPSFLAQQIAAFELWQADHFAVEPSPLPGESFESFLGRLYR